MNHTSSSRGFFTLRVALSLVLCFFAVILATLAWASRAETRPSALEAKIAPEVLAQAVNGAATPVVIFLTQQADVSAAHKIADQDTRGWFVYKTLTQHASRTQAALRADLDARAIRYETFWA